MKKSNRNFHIIKYLTGWVTFFLLLGCYESALANITTAEIIAHTMGALPECLHYQIKGACLWVSHTGQTFSTPYIAHYLPDVVVSVFNPPTDSEGGNAWLEIRNSLDLIGRSTESEIVKTLAHVSAGGGEHVGNDSLENNVFFKQVDVIGNPALETLPKDPLLHTSTAKPLKPYFQSMLDALLWRGFAPYAELEQADALVSNLTHSIGSPAELINWGGAFPFEGKVYTAHDTKAAAIIAQRAGNLLTATNTWGHVVKSLPAQCGSGCKAARIQENDDDTQFQLIFPVAEHTCHVFGRTVEYGASLESKGGKGAYVWILWRKYEGCLQPPIQSNLIGKTFL